MLNNSYSPSFNEVINHCQELDNENDILEYLSEIASYDFKCPDKCDKWAIDFYNDNENSIDTKRSK
jgi:hypothetical protein